MEEQLKDSELHASRGAKKLQGTKTVYYLRAGNQARLFFRYSDKEKEAVESIEFLSSFEYIDDIYDDNMDVSVNLKMVEIT